NGATTSNGLGDPNPCYINGQLINTVATSTSTTVNFPVGKVVSGVSNWRPFELTVKHTDATSVAYTGELIQSSAAALGYTNAAGTDKVSGIRYWDIARSVVANLTDATIKLYYKSDNGTNDGVTDFGNLTTVKTTGSGSPWIDIGGTATANGTGSIGFSNAFTSFSKFTLANKTDGNNALPIELLSFDAVFNGSAVELTWTTASEINNDYFTIERSDGTMDDWNIVGTVKGAGNSSTLRNYEFTDQPETRLVVSEAELTQNPETVLYYRLKQTDFDGRFKYSSVVSVKLKSKGEIRIFPNPLYNETAKLDLSGFKENEKITVAVQDVMGRELFSKIIIMDKATDIAVLDYFQKLHEGCYFVIVSSQKEFYKQKIIVQ
ncbi:MAG: T9SS type A sorting domain-containing protein, partial [Bacteroidia bacterium]|nr:T9SS type A sorting domain-containing protein [Bacteroidia bacterium]